MIKIYPLSLGFVEIYLITTKLHSFNKDIPLFVSIPSVVFSGSLLVALKARGSKSRFVGDEIRM